MPSLEHRIVDLLSQSSRALHASEIAARLGVPAPTLRSVLEDLVYDGLITIRAGRRFRLAGGVKPAPASAAVDGIVAANARGFAFVRVTGGDDVYVPPEAVGGAMHGDRVSLRIVSQSRRGPQGEIVEILERRPPRVVGCLRSRGTYLEPDDQRIRGVVIREGANLLDELDGPLRGDIAAVVDITRFPEMPNEAPEGRLVAVLGRAGEPDVEVAKTLIGHSIDENHPADAVTEARAFGSAPPADELARRVDLRDVPLITIDPADARDHDDAVWVERDDQGRYQAWIAIADVSHYVTPGSALDASARERGFSTYLPDRAVPMLPPELSAVLCSLLPEVERLCMCVHVELDATADVTRVSLHEGRMRARAFLSYDAVARALGFTTEPARDPIAEELRHELRVMWDLSSLLRKRRMRRGAMDLDIPETRVVIDDATRAPISVEQRGGDPGVKKAYRLIEELMLLANECVARRFAERERDCVYRVHGAPDPAKLVRFATAAELLGVDFDPEVGSDPKQLSRFLRKVAAHPHAGVLHNLLLRALQQASYDTTNIGHFGLASGAYLHFTSPIRRYPDLVVHRLLKAMMRKERPRVDGEELSAVAQRCSRRERTVMEAEREVADLYRALFMRQHIGDTFTGTVTAVTPGGVYVKLRDPFVDVLVPLDALGHEPYDADETGLRATAQRSGDTVTLGDELTLTVVDVAIERRAVYGRRLVEQRERGRPRRGRGSKQDRQRSRKQRSTRQERGRRKKRR